MNKEKNKHTNTSKKKLLMCYHSSNFGGVEKQILDIISGLSAKYNITVVCPDGPLLKDYLKAGAINHIDLKPKFEADITYSLKIAQIVKNQKIDVVHSHELLTGSLATFGAWLGRCPKRIYHVHTPFVEWRHSNFKRYFALIINTMVNFIVGNVFATDVLALTKSIKETRIHKEFIRRNKIRIIPNGVDLDQLKYDKNKGLEIRNKFNIPEDAIVVGNISRFTQEKGQEILIRAFAQLVNGKNEVNKKLKNSQIHNSFLVFAGSGILLDDSKKLVKDLNIDQKCIFLGGFEEKDKSAILSSYDYFVFPTYTEGFGIVLIEAMALDLPVLASDLPVLKDVAGENINYFKVGDVDDLKSKLTSLVFENENSSKIKTKNTSNYVKQYSMQNFWKNYDRLYTGDYF